MSLPPEILKKVKLLEINTRKLVNNIFSGEYHSAFRGQGMTFSEFREYVPGDDIRSISWPVTARTGKPFIKIFDEEREMSLMLAVDISGSNDIGSSHYFKGEAMTHLAALLGFSATKNNDPIGLLLFSDQVEHYVPPKKGRGHVHRMLRDLYYYRPHSRKTNLVVPIEHMQSVLKKRAHIFIFSDFFSEDYEKALRMLTKKHDVVAVVVNDPIEQQIPAMGLLDLCDPESGEFFTVDTSSPLFQKKYKEAVNEFIQKRDQMLRKVQIDRVDVTVGEDIVSPLVKFFKRRNLR